MSKKTEQAITNSALLVDLVTNELELAQKYEAVISQVSASKEVLDQLAKMSEDSMTRAGILQGLMQEFSKRAEGIEDGMSSVLGEEVEENTAFPSLNESAMRKAKLSTLAESILNEKEQKSERESKKTFTLTQEDVDGNIVDSYSGSAIGPLQKRVSSLMQDKDTLAKKGVTVIEVTDENKNQLYLAMQDEGTVDDSGNDNYDGDWVIYLDNLGNVTAYSDPALSGDDLYSRVYADLVQDDNSQTSAMRNLKDVPDSERYTYQEVTSTDGGLLVSSEDLIFALAVAASYGLNVKPRKDGVIILIPEEEEEQDL